MQVFNARKDDDWMLARISQKDILQRNETNNNIHSLKRNTNPILWIQRASQMVYSR